MSLWIRILLCVIAGYLLGGINGAIIVSKTRMHEDVRTKGSGNAGLTNFLRCYGGWMTVLVIVIDAAKVVVGCVLAQLLLKELEPALAWMIAGFSVQIGHIFPIFFGFRGGKGVLCTGALAFVMDWRVGCIALVLFFAVFFLTRYVSLSSFTGVLSAGAALTVLYWSNLYVCLLMAAMVFLVIFMHRSNIKRLLHGQERKTYFHKYKNENQK